MVRAQANTMLRGVEEWVCNMLAAIHSLACAAAGRHNGKENGKRNTGKKNLPVASRCVSPRGVPQVADQCERTVVCNHFKLCGQSVRTD